MSEATEMTGIPTQGEILLGKYRVERVLGQGGMGVVLAATHIQLEDRFAIKFLLAQSLASPDVAKRFLREAQASRRIKSEHVVRVFDVGTLENGAPYMIMEYLDGNDLGYLLEKAGPLPVPQAIDYLLQACEAIAEAHALGIIHRDLKPANLFVTRRADNTSVVKVLDFGISKIGPTGPDVGMTKTSAVMGSPRYMSPEQMRSTRSVDARSDVWALGAIMHELLSGHPVFSAETMTELCAQILQDTPPRIRVLRPDAPAEVEAAILRALEKDPAARFENVAQLALALAPFGTSDAQRSTDRIARILGAAGQRITQEPPAPAPHALAASSASGSHSGAGTRLGSAPAAESASASASPPVGTGSGAAPPAGTGTSWEDGSGLKKRPAGKATVFVAIASALVVVACVAAAVIVFVIKPGDRASSSSPASEPAASVTSVAEAPRTPPPATTAAATAPVATVAAPPPAPLESAPAVVAAVPVTKRGAHPAVSAAAAATTVATPPPQPPPTPVTSVAPAKTTAQPAGSALFKGRE